MEKRSLKPSKFAVIGATGNIGTKLVPALLRQADEVRVIARNAEHLKSLAALGAKAYPTDAAHVPGLVNAFMDVDVVFTMLPPSYDAIHARAYQNRITDATAEALEKAAIRYVVNLSSLGADRSEKVGIVKGLYDQEQRFNQIEGLNVVHLRPGYFMENELFAVHMIQQIGVLGGFLRPDIAIPMIAARDIAARAFSLMTSASFTGCSKQELLGARDYTMNEVASILGGAIGKPDLKYLKFSHEDFDGMLKSMGLSADVAAEMMELYTAINDGLVRQTETRSEANTTPTTFEQFAADTFSPFYQTLKPAA